MQLTNNVQSNKKRFQKIIRQSDEGHGNGLATLSKEGKPGQETLNIYMA